MSVLGCGVCVIRKKIRYLYEKMQDGETFGPPPGTTAAAGDIFRKETV